MAGYDTMVTELGDKIAGLTIAQAVELKNYLKEEYGIEPAGGGVMMAAAAGPAAAAPPPPSRPNSTSSSRPGSTRPRRFKSSRSSAKSPARVCRGQGHGRRGPEDD